MPNTDEWIQWEDSKWHLVGDNPSRRETACGEIVQNGEWFQVALLDNIPDTGYVCLHCVRWLIMKLREV